MACSRVNSAFTFKEYELLDCMYHIYKIKAETEMANLVAMQADERNDVPCQLQFL